MSADGRRALAGRPSSRLLRRLLAARADPPLGPGEAPLDLSQPGDVALLAIDYLQDVMDVIHDLEAGAVAADQATVLGEGLAWAAADLVQGLAPGVVAGPQHAPPVLGARILKRARWDGPAETAAFRMFQAAASELMPPCLALMRGEIALSDYLPTYGGLVHRIAAVVAGIKESDLPPLPVPKAFDP